MAELQVLRQSLGVVSDGNGTGDETLVQMILDCGKLVGQVSDPNLSALMGKIENVSRNLIAALDRARWLWLHRPP